MVRCLKLLSTAVMVECAVSCGTTRHILVSQHIDQVLTQVLFLRTHHFLALTRPNECITSNHLWRTEGGSACQGHGCYAANLGWTCLLCMSVGYSTGVVASIFSCSRREATFRPSSELPLLVRSLTGTVQGPGTVEK